MNNNILKHVANKVSNQNCGVNYQNIMPNDIKKIFYYKLTVMHIHWPYFYLLLKHSSLFSIFVTFTGKLSWIVKQSEQTLTVDSP